MARDPVHVELSVEGPFSLAASARFLEGFAPAGAFAAGAGLALAFPVEGDWRTAGALVREDGDRVVAELHGAAIDPEGVGAQLARILSLDVDAGGQRLAAFPAPAVLRGLGEIE